MREIKSILAIKNRRRGCKWMPHARDVCPNITDILSPAYILYNIHLLSLCAYTHFKRWKKIFTIKKQSSACKQRRTPAKRKMHTCAEYVYLVSTFIVYLYSIHYTQWNNNNDKYNNKRKSRFLSSRQKNCVRADLSLRPIWIKIYFRIKNHFSWFYYNR